MIKTAVIAINYLKTKSLQTAAGNKKLKSHIFTFFFLYRCHFLVPNFFSLGATLSLLTVIGARCRISRIKELYDPEKNKTSRPHCVVEITGTVIHNTISTHHSWHILVYRY
ncbi:hypothetical protein NL108_002792 [Boleophthalmus pectinirostris]|nr:hypothetical protein NL108_002792 [Boleophthalmus pectinirostris]